MIEVIRTNSENKDFIELVRHLDIELAERDGNEHAFYSQFNKIDTIKYAVVAYQNKIPVGCGAIKQFSADAMEVKRMYVIPESRGAGVATKILNALENWSAEMGFAKCILETGKKQPEAIQLYKKNGYDVIESYGQYLDVENSVCFQKEIKNNKF